MFMDDDESSGDDEVSGGGLTLATPIQEAVPNQFVLATAGLVVVTVTF